METNADIKTIISVKNFISESFIILLKLPRTVFINTKKLSEPIYINTVKTQSIYADQKYATELFLLEKPPVAIALDA